MENYSTFRWAMLHKEAYSYLLLTRSPLNLLFTLKSKKASKCKKQVPLDLHVLGTSPAFTLSHDQTLSTNILNKFRKVDQIATKNFFEFFLVLTTWLYINALKI